MIAPQLVVSALALSPLLASPLAAQSSVTAPNVLIVLADDLGIDGLASYGFGTDLPNTPRLDQLAAQGTRFVNVWSSPACSPARATLQTGRHGFRTGIGYLVQPLEDPYVLPSHEVTLPEMLDAGTGQLYAHAMFGKWHLSSVAMEGVAGPNLAGWSHYVGVPSNLTSLHVPWLPSYDYFTWPQVEDNAIVEGSGYITSATVDWTIDWVQQQSGPWCAFVSFHAAHDPLHAPPSHLHTEDLSAAGTPKEDPRPYYKAMVEAMDTEIGRLIDTVDPTLQDTVVIFLGDNGTEADVAMPPIDPLHAKLSMFENGVRVPLIVAGPAVQHPGSTSKALVGVIDLFATVAELAGADPASLAGTDAGVDSISFVDHLLDPGAPSKRDVLYAEMFRPNGLGANVVSPAAPGTFDFVRRAVRDERYKYIEGEGAAPLLFDLAVDPLEKQNLLNKPLSPEEQRALRKLVSAMEALLAS